MSIQDFGSTAFGSLPAFPLVHQNPSLPDGVELLVDQLYLFSVDQYHRMGEAGIFEPDDRTELIEGVIIRMSPIGLKHFYSVSHLTNLLVPLVSSAWFISPQNPVTCRRSEPQPDLSVIRGSVRDFSRRLPQPGDVALIIEVADSSLRVDRKVKGKLYAEAGVPEYWIVNASGRCVEVFRLDPSSPKYQSPEVFDATRSVPLVLDGKKLAMLSVEDLLPSPAAD